MHDFCFLSCSLSVLVVNGVQPIKHENGLSAKGNTDHFEDILQLANHSNGREKSEADISDEPIMAFDSGESFLKKTGPIKPQHVAGNISTGVVRQCVSLAGFILFGSLSLDDK